MSERIGPFVVGEKPAPLTYVFQDANGVPISFLGGGYNARFTTREHWAAAPAVDNAAVAVANDASGQVTYTWTGAEFPTPGHYHAELWIGNGSNRFASVKLEYDVRAPVGTVPSI
jgi:hypothetical protein